MTSGTVMDGYSFIIGAPIDSVKSGTDEIEGTDRKTELFIQNSIYNFVDKY